MDEIDDNSDGRITFEEFVRFFEVLTSGQAVVLQALRRVTEVSPATCHSAGFSIRAPLFITGSEQYGAHWQGNHR